MMHPNEVRVISTIDGSPLKSTIALAGTLPTRHHVEALFAQIARQRREWLEARTLKH